MKRSKKIVFLGLCFVNSLVAIVIWLMLYARGYAFHLAGVYFTPGIFVFSGMLLIDILLFFVFSRKPH